MKWAGVVGFFCAVLASAVAVSAPEEGIVLKSLDGQVVYADSLLKTGPLVLNFWATWCMPCRLEMPHLQSLQKELAPRRVHFAAVSLDSPRHEKYVAKYVEKYAVTLPVYRDAEGTLARRFRVVAIPTTVILGQDGEIHHTTRGYRPGDEVMLKKKIEALLKESEEPAPVASDR